MALPVSSLVNIQINLSPTAAAVRSFGVLLVGGDSNVISGLERVRTYIGVDQIATDFGTNAPEYKAAALYFSQVPKPSTIMIARWLRTASSAQNVGGVLSASDQTISNFTSVTNGGLVISVDGVTKTLTGLNFSGAGNLNAVATLINAALTGAVATWTGSNFVITSSTTGASSSTVGYATTGSGTDISVLLKLTAATAQVLVPGYDAETPVQFAAALANKSSAWYGLMFAASTQPTDDQRVAVAGFIEPLTVTRIFGTTIQDPNVLSSVVTSDLASRLMALAYKRTFSQYSSTSPYAIASFFGRAFSVNFSQNNSTISLMFKTEPGVINETLDYNTSLVLKSKRCNVFVSYDNDTTIIQYGTMAGPAWFDEIHGLDWLQNATQTACYNVLYLTKTKIPQTDNGVNALVNSINGVLDQAVNNRLVAPGVWNADGFGGLSTGDYLKTGYYVYAQPVALQSQSDRDARKAPPITAAIKLAGAIQSVDALINVNR